MSRGACLWDNIVAHLIDPVDPDFVRTFQHGDRIPAERPEMMIAERLPVPARTWQEVGRAMLAADFADELPPISAPTLVDWGMEDPLCSEPEQQKSIHEESMQTLRIRLSAMPGMKLPKLSSRIAWVVVGGSKPFGRATWCSADVRCCKRDRSTDSTRSFYSAIFGSSQTRLTFPSLILRDQPVHLAPGMSIAAHSCARSIYGG